MQILLRVVLASNEQQKMLQTAKYRANNWKVSIETFF